MDRIRSEDCPLRRRTLLVLAGAICVGALFLALVLLLGSCSSTVEGAIARDGSARIDFRAEVPAAIADKLRKLISAGGPAGGPAGVAPGVQAAPLFDLAAIRSSIEARPGLGLAELSRPSPESIRGSVTVASLSALAAGSEPGGTGALAYSADRGWAELRLRLARGAEDGLAALLPGIDPYLLDALSPPALEEEGVGAMEYREMLKAVFGASAAAAMEGAAVLVSLTAPDAVISSGGGELEGRTLKARIPVIDALVLEEPIELWIRWRR